jgi:uncharacterized protein (DUF1800 family)
MSLLGLCLIGGIEPAHAQTAPTARQLAQHLLRRFGFSASPAAVSAVVSEGTAAWLAQQLDWQSIDDTKSELDSPPHKYHDPTKCNFCLPNWNAFEALIYQHNMLTNRQLQAKLELHWLDHFSLSQNSVDPPSLYNYDAIVRKNALGNFATLVAAVGTSPAMLFWLDNNGNTDTGPNVNWARELMQLYTIGEWQLNPDGSQVLDGSGMPIPNYGESDIKTLAQVMSGYTAVFTRSPDPMEDYSVSFTPANQLSGTVQFLGGTYTVPNDDTAIAFVVNILAHHPSAAPFQVTELLKRFVTETPSPQFISDIVAVWVKYAESKDQIGQVVSAIVNHPDFAAAYHAMPKQPVEKIFDALRALPGMMQAKPPAPFKWTGDQQAGQSLEWYLSGLNQDIFYPPNVFSFYLPGNLSSMTTTAAIASQSASFTYLIESSPPQPKSKGTDADTWIDVPTLMKTIGSADGTKIADYLLDALVDGGSPGMQSVIQNYLGTRPSVDTVHGAIWLILNSPEYAVN